MKNFVFLILTVLSFSAWADGNNFYLLNHKCEAEESAGVETTPQSPPLNVDDPSTPGCNRWEVNITLDGDLTKKASDWELPLLDINYGVGDNLQLKYEVPFVSQQSDGVNTSAMGISKFGVKYMFLENEESKLQVAIYPQLEFITPGTNAVTQGQVQPGTITTLPVLLSKKVGETSKGDILMTANLGFNVSTRNDVQNFVNVSLGLGTSLSRKVALMGEISTEQAVVANADGGRDQIVKAGVGFITSLSKNVMAYGSLGRSLYSSDQESHTYVLTGLRVLAGGM